MPKLGRNQAGGLHSKRSVMQAINLPGAGSLKRPDHILLDPITDKAQRTVSTVLCFSGMTVLPFWHAISASLACHFCSALAKSHKYQHSYCSSIEKLNVTLHE